MNQLLGENECEILTHSQQQSQAPKTHKKESTVRLTTRIMCDKNFLNCLVVRRDNMSHVTCCDVS